MLTNIHGEPIRDKVEVSSSGDNIVIPAITDGEIFIHELIGDATAVVTLTIKAGTRDLGKFTLDAGQGLTEGDTNSMGGEPRFKCYQNEAFILNLSGAVTFSGSIFYSYKR